MVWAHLLVQCEARRLCMCAAPGWAQWLCSGKWWCWKFPPLLRALGGGLQDGVGMGSFCGNCKHHKDPRGRCEAALLNTAFKSLWASVWAKLVTWMFRKQHKADREMADCPIETLLLLGSFVLSIRFRITTRSLLSVGKSDHVKICPG